MNQSQYGDQTLNPVAPLYDMQGQEPRGDIWGRDLPAYNEYQQSVNTGINARPSGIPSIMGDDFSIDGTSVGFRPPRRTDIIESEFEIY